MSAIDMYASVDKVVGKHGEDRVVITLNGKFLPHIEQRVGEGDAVVEGEGMKKKGRGRPRKNEK